MKHASDLIIALTTVLLLTACESSNSLVIQTVNAESILSSAATHSGDTAVLVNFWATTCAPCIKEFPFIMDLGREYESKGLRIYFVSIDFPDYIHKVRTFLKSQHVRGISYHADLSDPNGFIDTIHKNWTGAVPFTIVFGKSTGEVVDYWEGEKNRDRFEQAILKAIQS